MADRESDRDAEYSLSADTDLVGGEHFNIFWATISGVSVVGMFVGAYFTLMVRRFAAAFDALVPNVQPTTNGLVIQSNATTTARTLDFPLGNIVPALLLLRPCVESE